MKRNLLRLSLLICTAGFAVNALASTVTLPVEFTHQPTVQNMTVGQQQVLNYSIKSNVPQTLPLTISGFSGQVSRNNAISNNCGSSIGPNASCNIQLVINAQSQGAINQKLNIDYQGRYPLTSPIDLVVGGPALTFTQTPTVQNMLVNRAQMLQYTIQNTSQGTVNFTIGGFSAPITRDNTVPNNCGTSLAPGASCVIKLNVQPTNTGQIQQLLTISSATNADNLNQTLLESQIDLTVFGLAVKTDESTPSYTAFAGKTVTGKVVITNPSTVDTMTGLDPVLSVPVGVDLTITNNTCTSSLAPGASCDVDIQFTAANVLKDKAGNPVTAATPPTSDNATLELNYDDGGSTQVEYLMQTSSVPNGRFVNLPQNKTGYNQLPAGNIAAVAEDQTGDIMVGTPRGAAESEDGEGWINFTATNGLPVSDMTSVGIDGDDYMMGTQVGVACTDDRGANYTVATTDQGLPSDEVYAVLPLKYTFNKTGAIQPVDFVGTTAGLVRSFDNCNSFDDVLPGEDINALAYQDVNGQNRVYVGTFGNGVFISEDGGDTFPTHRTAANSNLADDFVTAITAEGDMLLVGTEFGASYSTNNGQNFTTLAGGIPANTFITAVAIDGQNLYVGTEAGLYVSNNGGTSFTLKTTANGLGSNDITSLSLEGATLLVGTDNGLAQSTDNGASFTNQVPTNQLASSDGKGVWAVNLDYWYAGLPGAGKGPGGVSYSDDEGVTFATATTAQGLPSNDARSVQSNGQDVAVAAGFEYGFSDDKGVSYQGYDPQIPGNPPLAYGYVDAAGNDWVAVGGDYFSKSTNLGANWAPVDLGAPATWGYIEGSDAYAATLGSGVKYSTNGGVSFINSSGVPANVNSGAVDQSDINNVYAATTTGLYKSTNKGADFSLLWDVGNGKLPGDDVTGVVADGAIIAVSTTSGVAYTADGGTTVFQATTAEGLPSNNETGVAISGLNVIISGEGGMAETDLPVALTKTKQAKTKKSADKKH